MWLFTTESPTIILPHYLGLKFTLGVVETSQYIHLNTVLMVENFEERPDELCHMEKLEGHYTCPSLSKGRCI